MKPLDLPFQAISHTSEKLSFGRVYDFYQCKMTRDVDHIKKDEYFPYISVVDHDYDFDIRFYKDISSATPVYAVLNYKEHRRENEKNENSQSQ